MLGDDHIVDEIGRCFCKAHKRETCHECCLCFEPTNRMAEENAGLVRKRTDIEFAAEDFAIAQRALRGMEQMVPRPNEEIWEQNRMYLQEAEAKLQNFREQGKDTEVDAALEKAIQKKVDSEIEMSAMAQAFHAETGKSTFEFGGPETQKLYEKYVATPNYESNPRVDFHTCAYCHKVSEKKLRVCSRCKKVTYCDRDCQKKAWKAHKKICVPVENSKVKCAMMTWDQLEDLNGLPANGRTLEVRAVLDESVTRQVMRCKDNNGVMKRIAAYTNSRSIPGLKPGTVLQWKNPRFHYFMDGSSGARIEEEDLVNVVVK